MPPATCPVTNVTISTPFKARAWATRLIASRYPNPQAAHVLVRSLRTGVDISFFGDRSRKQTGPNLSTAHEHPDAVDNNIEKELGKGRRIGPFSVPPFPFYYSNPLGVVFKRNKPKPRVIHHLSWPRDTSRSSVNASTIEFQTSHDALDQAIRSVRQLGRGCFLAKLDIEAAYRCIPVSPNDWPLLGLLWRRHYYFDTVVPFGLAPASAIFEWYSTAAQHILQVALAIQHLVHYIDDFMLIMHGIDATRTEIEQMLSLFDELGIPIALDKLEGPLTRMVFLGILFDTVAMTISLDAERLEELHAELNLWSGKLTASRQQLQSLIGQLSFAAKVVPTGRTFIRRMIDHMKSIPPSTPSDRETPLSNDFYRDLFWWHTFLSKWNGVGIVPDAEWSPAQSLHIYTDACVTGYGAVCGSQWFQGLWSPEQEAEAVRDQRDSMPFKELYPLSLAAATWGHRWQGKKIMFHCDCLPVVQAWDKGDSSKPSMSRLIRSLLFIASTHDFNMRIIHIKGKLNDIADCLSRGQHPDSLSFPHQLDPSPTIPSPLPTHTW